VAVQLLLQLVVVLGVQRAMACRVALAVAQVKVQQAVLLHLGMVIQVQLNRDIRVVLRVPDYFTAAVAEQDKQDKMDPLLLQELAETGHLFPGHLLRMVQLVQHQDDGLRVEVVQEDCQTSVISQVAQAAQAAAVKVKVDPNNLDSQVT
jgi:hydrogenase maturation factor